MQEVFYMDVTPLLDAQVFEEGLQKVSEVRREKVLRCRNQMDQLRSLGAGLLLLRACQLLEIKASDVALLPEALLCDMSGKYYGNISHAGNMVAVVISSTPSGIDIESEERFLGEKKQERMESILRKIGTEAEIQNILALANAEGSSDMQASAMAKLWTRKEARAKAEGLGLGMDLTTIDTGEERFVTFRIESDTNYALSIFPQTEELHLHGLM